MAVNTIQAPESTTRPVDVSRQVGDADDTARPIAVAKAVATKKQAAATKAPPKIELHWKNIGRAAPGTAVGST
jgi:hypothetical protein